MITMVIRITTNHGWLDTTNHWFWLVLIARGSGNRALLFSFSLFTMSAPSRRSLLLEHAVRDDPMKGGRVCAECNTAFAPGSDNAAWHNHWKSFHSAKLAALLSPLSRAADQSGSTDDDDDKAEEEEPDEMDVDDEPDVAAAATSASSRRRARREPSAVYASLDHFVAWFIGEHSITAATAWNADLRNVLIRFSSRIPSPVPNAKSIEEAIRSAVALTTNHTNHDG